MNLDALAHAGGRCGVRQHHPCRGAGGIDPVGCQPSDCDAGGHARRSAVHPRTTGRPSRPRLACRSSNTPGPCCRRWKRFRRWRTRRKGSRAVRSDWPVFRWCWRASCRHCCVRSGNCIPGSMLSPLKRATTRSRRCWPPTPSMSGWCSTHLPRAQGLPAGAGSWLAVVPMGHRFARPGRRGVVPLAELVSEPFVLATGGCEVTAETVVGDTGLALADVRVKVRDWSSAFSLVREGVGLSLVPELALPADRKRFAGAATRASDSPQFWPGRFTGGSGIDGRQGAVRHAAKARLTRRSTPTRQHACSSCAYGSFLAG